MADHLVETLDKLLAADETAEEASGGLKSRNPFSLAFLGEGLLDLGRDGLAGSATYLTVAREKVIPLLVKAISSSGLRDVAGSVRIEPYPPSAYLTQLAFRVTKRLHDTVWAELPQPKRREFGNLKSKVRGWARAEVNRQMVLIMTGSRTADPMQLAYAIILVSSTSSTEHSTPEEKALTAAALKLFFSKQNPDGSWPPSQPLFHYPHVGNAQCFEYELLTQMLLCRPLQSALRGYLVEFRRAVDRLAETAFQLESSTPGEHPIAWASGHHPQIEGPESWSTACVYDFCHMLGRLVAEAIRRSLFAEVSSEYSSPIEVEEFSRTSFDGDFLDAKLAVDGQPWSLKKVLMDAFVRPIADDRHIVANGGKLQKKTPMSAILFGPPGTSKTELAKMMAKCLGWPLLSVDPSYLVQDGIEHLYSRANKLFSMLAVAEQVVAFLDEFDEMGRERTDNAEISSRFITTAMLPKLAALNKSRQIVVILATNFIENFDAAFSRGGRFDMIVQVMPPKLSEKLRGKGWEILSSIISKLPTANQLEAEDALRDLTYLETVHLVDRLTLGSTDKLQEILKAAQSGTLARQHGPDDTWKSISVKQREHIRLPPLFSGGSATPDESTSPERAEHGDVEPPMIR